MKILILSAETDGGAGIAAIRQAAILRKIGHEVEIESLNSSDNLGRIGLIKRKLFSKINRKFEYEVTAKIDEKDGLYKSTIYLPFWTLGKIPFSKYDVIHLHWINRGFLGLNHIKKIHKKNPNIVWTLHSLWPHYNHNHHPRSFKTNHKSVFMKLLIKREKYELKKIDFYLSAWVVPSKFMVDRINSKKKIYVVNNCLENEITLSPNDAPISSRFAFLCNGDVFHPKKGLINLLDAWSNTIYSKANFKLFIIGPVHESTKDASRMAIAKINNVEFIGELPSAIIPKFLSNFTAVFVPSYEETFGQIILESLSAGTPVIANKHIASLSEFSDFEDWLYRINFSELPEFESTIRVVLENKRSRQDLAKKVSERFSPSKIAAELTSIYLEFKLNRDD